MRKFCSYGPIDPDIEYYVPRKELLDQVIKNLIGENPNKGGHYFTVWAPRQTGKSWIMNQALHQLRKNNDFLTIKLELESLKRQKDPLKVVQSIGKRLQKKLGWSSLFPIENEEDLQELFLQERLEKPLILILDEFDSLCEEAISGVVGIFRNIYQNQKQDWEKTTGEKEYLLHSVALIGVRSVLGIENKSGSPFNIQRSLAIPRLTKEETWEMFRWYEKESGQKIEEEVIEQVYDNTRGQPGLVSWLGELLTETFNEEKNKPITMKHWDNVFLEAIDLLPNSSVLNIISKAKEEPYRKTVLELFQTDEKLSFRFDEPDINFLYMHGVIDYEKVGSKAFLRFPCPFIQKKLFNYFSVELFPYVGKKYEPHEDLGKIITKQSIDMKNLFSLYQQYIHKNREWLFKKAPRRSDMRIYEVVFHFNLYLFLSGLLQKFEGSVYPEFPTGNGKIDLLIRYANQTYGLELKTFTDLAEYKNALKQAAHYGKQLKLTRISLVFFIESIDQENRKKFEVEYSDPDTGVLVTPFFIETGN